MSSNVEGTEPKRRRSAPLLWGGGALAAAILVLGVNGTLSDWTTAIITNDNNTVDSASSVVLEESGPDSTGTTTTCTTSGTASNTDTCSTINKYGANGVAATGATALQPGQSVSTTVNFTNTGSGDASSFTLTPGSCSSIYVSGVNAGNAPAAGDDLCTQLTVAVACAGDVTLTVPATPLSTFTGDQAFSAGMASGQSTSCTFTVSLPATTPANYSGQQVTQNLVWTLSA